MIKIWWHTRKCSPMNPYSRWQLQKITHSLIGIYSITPIIFIYNSHQKPIMFLRLSKIMSIPEIWKGKNRTITLFDVRQGERKKERWKVRERCSTFESTHHSIGLDAITCHSISRLNTNDLQTKKYFSHTAFSANPFTIGLCGRESQSPVGVCVSVCVLCCNLITYQVL